MRFVRCAWRSSNKKTSWGFVRANMPFIESASLSGWRWGRCARCATCPSCSSLSRPAARIHLCQYSSLYPALRTWCSRLGPSPIVHYRHTQTRIPLLILSPVQVHLRYESVDTAEKLEFMRRYSQKAWLCGHRHLSYPCIGSQKDLLISVLTENQLLSCFSFHGLWRRVDLEVCFLAKTWSDDDFFSTKALFWGHQLKTRRKKQHKSQELQYAKISIVWKQKTKKKLNKHFTRRQTLIACDASSKVMFYILSLTIISVYSTKPHGLSF